MSSGSLSNLLKIWLLYLFSAKGLKYKIKKKKPSIKKISYFIIIFKSYKKGVYLTFNFKKFLKKKLKIFNKNLDLVVSSFYLYFNS